MTLDKSKQDRFLAWLDSKGVRRDCPACGSIERHAGDIVAPPSAPTGGGTVVGGPNYPLVQLVCSNCGYVMHFASTKMAVPM